MAPPLSLVRPEGLATDEEYRRLVDQAADAERAAPPADRFRLLTVEEVEALPPPTWLVAGLLPDGAAAELHGPPGAGKSFLALDLAMSIASGQPFCGRPVRHGAVVYVVGEGNRGVGPRLTAWKTARRRHQGIRMRLVDEPPQLLEPADIAAFCQAIETGLGEPAVLIVLDTLARCFVGGEENSARDMGVAVAAVDRLRRRTGACVLLVHHTRKAGDEERGSVALRGGMDTMMSLKEEESGLVLHCEKQKDAAEFADIPIQLGPVGGSLVVQEPGVRLNAGRKTLAVLARLVQDFPGGSATATEWREASGVQAQAYYKARGELLRRQYVAEQKVGNSTRYAPTPEGKIALAMEAKEAHETRAVPAVPEQFPENDPAHRGSSAGGLGGLHPSSAGVCPPTTPSPTGVPASNGHPNSSSSSNGSGTVPVFRDDPDDVFAELDERLGMRGEPPMED